MKIRALRTEDEADWRRLWHGYNVFYERVDSVSDAATEQTWRRLLCPDVQPYGFGAEADSKLIGFTHYWFEESTAETGKRIYLQDLMVDPESRGNGAGRALIEAVYRAADEAGATGVFWLTQEFNETARRLYDRLATVTPFIKYQR